MAASFSLAPWHCWQRLPICFQLTLASICFCRTKVHLTAPGEDIFTTSFDGKFGSASGTSMATPIVTGAAALVQSVAQAVGESAALERCCQLYQPSIQQ